MVNQIDTIEIEGGGLTARILTWGATLQSLTPDWLGKSVILGSNQLEAYCTDRSRRFL